MHQAAVCLWWYIPAPPIRLCLEVNTGKRDALMLAWLRLQVKVGVENSNNDTHHISWSIFSRTNLRLRDGKMHFRKQHCSQMSVEWSLNATTTRAQDGGEDTTVCPQSPALQWLSEEEGALTRFIHWVVSPGKAVPGWMRLPTTLQSAR